MPKLTHPTNYDGSAEVCKRSEPVHEISINVSILTCVDSDEPLQPLFKLRNSK